MKRKYDLLLLGYYGFGNLGDELLAEACLGLALKSGIKKERIAILTASPKKDEQRYGIKAFNRWSPMQLISACLQSRTLLLGGGGLFQESTSLRSCVYYWGAVKAAKLLGCSPWAAGQSVGPISSAAASFLTKSALSACSSVSVRDKNSQRLLVSLGVQSRLCCDLVLSLVTREPLPEKHEKLLVFNARPGYRAVAEEAAKKASAFAAEKKLKIRAAALSEEDLTELESLQKAGLIKFDSFTKISDINEALSLFAGAEAAVGMRLHFVLLAAAAGLPVAGAVYDPKVEGFCSRFGIETVGEKLLLNKKPERRALVTASDSLLCAFREDFRKKEKKK